MNLLAPFAAPDIVRPAADAAAAADAVQRPALTLLGSEPLRAAAELARHALTPNPPAARPGDGHPVILFPGLGSDGLALAPLRAYCESLGYRAMGWDYGRNTGPKGDIDAWLDTLADHTRGLLAGERRQPTFLGWSLGGLYARELAKRMPHRVRQVITFGTPFNLADDHTNVGWVLRLLNGSSCALDDALCARLREPPPVPTTSIFSRGDGVVAWEACRHASPGRRDVQDLEVEGSHLGMGWNPAVMRVVADRLAQRRARWRPMRLAG
jgi:pimeloyl-ACP methyl ester carboxylesterase